MFYSEHLRYYHMIKYSPENQLSNSSWSVPLIKLEFKKVTDLINQQCSLQALTTMHVVFNHILVVRWTHSRHGDTNEWGTKPTNSFLICTQHLCTKEIKLNAFFLLCFLPMPRIRTGICLALGWAQEVVMAHILSKKITTISHNAPA